MFISYKDNHYATWPPEIFSKSPVEVIYYVSAQLIVIIKSMEGFKIIIKFSSI